MASFAYAVALNAILLLSNIAIFPLLLQCLSTDTMNRLDALRFSVVAR